MLLKLTDPWGSRFEEQLVKFRGTARNSSRSAKTGRITNHTSCTRGGFEKSGLNLRVRCTETTRTERAVEIPGHETTRFSGIAGLMLVVEQSVTADKQAYELPLHRDPSLKVTALAILVWIIVNSTAHLWGKLKRNLQR